MIEIKYNILYGLGLNYYSDQYFLTLFVSTDHNTLRQLLEFRKYCNYDYDTLRTNYETEWLSNATFQFQIPKSILTFGSLKESIISSIKDLQENSTKQMMNIDNEIGYMNFFSRLFLKYGDEVKIYDL